MIGIVEISGIEHSFCLLQLEIILFRHMQPNMIAPGPVKGFLHR